MRSIVTSSKVLAAMILVLLTPLSSSAAPPKKPTGDDVILQWNAIALQVVVDDHSGTYGSAVHGGPTRSSRALAIVHIAMFDALNAIDGSFEPYIPVGSPPAGASIDAAVAQAAHGTLLALYPNQQTVLERQLKLALNRVPGNRGRAAGVTVGKAAALNILAARSADGAAAGDTPIYVPTVGPGAHQVDPLNPGQGLLTPGWGQVDTFSGINVTDAGLRTPPPAALTSPEYTDAFLDVQFLGGDGITTPTLRTQEETDIGLFWAYDGSNEIGVPPVLYNQIVRVLVKQEGNTPIENARLFALVNIAMGDAGIAAWDSKYFYNFWRPIVAIRSATSDGNPDTIQVDDWIPLCAPASNQSGNNFTPPFPAYPSGHATFGAAMFRILENFYGRDNISFRLMSDELSGRTTDNLGNHRRTVVRHFTSFSKAAAENGRSRVYLGIHWQFDADSGIDQGITVADAAFTTLLLPAN